MNHLDAYLVAEAARLGRAVRSATRRHRHLSDTPLMMMAWQLGAEPFSIAAAAAGTSVEDLAVVVPGEPRNRTLLFEALHELARSFNAYFEDDWAEDDAPQLVVPNDATMKVWWRIGRRLRGLRTTGDGAISEELYRFGAHLRFLERRSHVPGQQLVVSLTGLLNHHWAHFLSTTEAQNLPALDAVIAPGDMHGHDAALAVEHIEIGPVPLGADDRAIEPLMKAFNQRRHVGRDPRKEYSRIVRHYRQRLNRGWGLAWRCFQREQALLEAPSVSDRWQRDCWSFHKHRERLADTGYDPVGIDDHAKAIKTLNSWEQCQAETETSEVLDDPLRMVRCLIANEAMVGQVRTVNDDRKRKVNVRWVLRPTITLELNESSAVVRGKPLYWSAYPSQAWELIQEHPPLGGRRRVTLELQTRKPQALPRVDDPAVFSIYGKTWTFKPVLPEETPWTHQHEGGHR